MDIGKDMKEIIKEEVIQFLKNIKTDDKDKINNVIGFLERGWKFEDMWEEFEKKYGNYYYAYDVRGDVCKKHEYIKTFLDEVKQKYFPPKFDKVNKV